MAKIKKAQAGLTAPQKFAPRKKGAWITVQDENLPPVNKKTKVSLTRDKELGATKMKKGGKVPKGMHKMPDGSLMKGSVHKAKGGKWIQSAIKKPGALRSALGVKKGQKIPAGKLAAAAKKPGKMGQRARLAQTLGKLRKKK